MKFQLPLKAPDMDAVISEALDANPAEAKQINDVKALCSKWFQYGEYLTVEIDSDAETIQIVPVRS